MHYVQVCVDGNLSLLRAVSLTVQLIRLDSSTYLSGTIHLISGTASNIAN